MIRLMPGALLAALTALPVATLAGSPVRQAPQAPVFRASADLVQVDVIVHDREDRFVLGVTPDDLEVFEDGVPQRIEQFYLVAGSPEIGRSALGGPQSPRVFVLVFDEADLEVSALQRIKKGAEAFVMDVMREGDLGGLVVNGQFYAGKLTTDRGLLLAGIRAVRPAFDSRESRLRAFREFPRIPGESEAVRIVGGDAFLLQELGDEACREDVAQCNQEGGLQMVENKLQQKARLYLGQARDATRYTLDALQVAAAGAAAVPGRKTIVLLSDGFFVEESRSVLPTLAGIASRAGATIYAVDGRGLTGGRRALPDVLTATRPIDGSLDTGADGPEMLASRTGGFVVRQMDDVGRALGIIARDTSTYYVLGYRPVNATMDGTYRTIKVRAKSDRLSVRARTGYVALKR